MRPAQRCRVAQAFASRCVTALGRVVQYASERGRDLARLERLGEQLTDARGERLLRQERAAIPAHESFPSFCRAGHNRLHLGAIRSVRLMLRRTSIPKKNRVLADFLYEELKQHPDLQPFELS